jgi:hypothetical protein
MQSRLIYGNVRIAEYLEVSESTLRRWLKGPEAWCFKVGSMDNTGGGYGRARFGEISSLDHLKEVMRARTSDERKKAAQKRWGHFDVSSGSNFKSR